MNVLVTGLKEGCVNVRVKHSLTVRELKDRLSTRLSIESSTYHLTRHGSPLDESDTIDYSDDSSVTLITAHPLIRGGKGGFGSLIRAMGSHINKSTNKEACRDLSGRRMRDVNAEKKIAKWIASEPERKKKKLEEKQKKLDRYKNPPKHRFDDPTYMEQIREVEENMDTALKQGLEAASSSHGTKRGPSEASSSGPSKKAKMWVGLDSSELTDSSGTDDDDDSDDDEEFSPPLMLKTSGSSPKEDEPHSSTSEEFEGSSRVKDQEQSDEGSSHAAGPSSTQEQSESTESSTQPNTSDQQAKEPGESEGSSQKADTSNEPIDLEGYSSAEELMSVGLERLKLALQSLGLKCGGTLKERAERLFSTKGKSKDEIDPSLFAKGGKQKRKNK